MQFGIFYEHQLPRPWAEGAEHRLFKDALDQVELADRLGIDFAWEVEHHFLEEYSHSSAPEVFLAACTQRTKRIRLGHGITLMLPPYNHPARVAERIATLDLVSDGRVEWGTGSSSSRIELEGFGINPQEKFDMWRESVREATRMLSVSPYPGYQGQFFSMPTRNVVPRPFQRPHPPLWVACSNRETMKTAARLGMGALTFAFVDPDEAARWVEEYYTTFENECEPIGRTVNPNVAMVAGFMCHPDSATAAERGLEGFRFFGYALSHYYIHGTHLPGHFDLWSDFQQNAPPRTPPNAAIGNPDEVRAYLERMEAAGVDQVIFIQQAGRNQHEHICESLELFAREVLPPFQERHAANAPARAAALAPHIERAIGRMAPLPTVTPELVDSYPVLMRKLAAAEGEPAQDDSPMVSAIAGRRASS
jgi:alkanesulfonate monooxygenase SsuD/methylene tetrahydromethanopterin reductase-like flavin-dependent oxidoreductase (luciferase family)